MTEHTPDHTEAEFDPTLGAEEPANFEPNAPDVATEVLDAHDAETTEVLASPVDLEDMEPEETTDRGNNLDMILDVQLPIVVELGRTKMLIKDIVGLQRGSVVTLDKMAGEPANLVINGKVLATGEIVVIDDNFGIRLTNMVSRVERLKSLQ